MPPSLAHLLRSPILAIVAGLLVPVILFRNVRIGAEVFRFFHGLDLDSRRRSRSEDL